MSLTIRARIVRHPGHTRNLETGDSPGASAKAPAPRAPSRMVKFRADAESGSLRPSHIAARPIQSGLSPNKEEEQDEARGDSIETEVQPERSQGSDGSQ
jgi:hypothetical protein